MKLHEAREKQTDICVTALKFGDPWLVHTRQTTSTKQIILRFTVARAARDVTRVTNDFVISRKSWKLR